MTSIHQLSYEQTQTLVACINMLAKRTEDKNVESLWCRLEVVLPSFHRFTLMNRAEELAARNWPSVLNGNHFMSVLRSMCVQVNPIVKAMTDLDTNNDVKNILKTCPEFVSMMS